MSGVPAPDPAAWPPLPAALAPAAGALLDWAARTDDACPRTCLVTGPRGAGKSRLLAWLLAGSGSHPATVVHAVVPAERQTAASVAWELGRQLGYGPLTPGDLLDRVAADRRPIRLLLPDLHLAGRGPADLPAAAPEALVAELVAPLLALPHVRAALGTGRRELLPVPGALVLELPAPAEPPPPPEAPAAAPPGTDWRTAPARLREEALDAALAADGPRAAARLLADPSFLVHGSPTAVTAALADPRVPAPPRLRAAWRAAAPVLSSAELGDLERAAVLHAAAAGTDPRLAEYLRPLAEQHGWTAGWTLPRRGVRAAATVPAPATRDTPDAPDAAEAPGAAGRAGPALVTADALGRLDRHPDAARPDAHRMPGDPVARPVGLTAPDADWLLGVDESGTLRPIPLDPGRPVPPGAVELTRRRNAAWLLGGEGAARPTAVAADRGAVAVADSAGGITLWPGAADGRPEELRADGLHPGPVTGVACLRLTEPDVVLVLTGGPDGSVRLWDSATGEAMPEPVERRNAVPTALAAAHTEVGPVLAVAWSDRRLHLWQLRSGRLAVLPLLAAAEAAALDGAGTLVLAGPEGVSCLRLRPDRIWG